LNILFIVFNIIGEGTYLRAYELARALSELGHSLTILASSSEVRKSINSYSNNGIQIIEVPNLFKGSIRAGWDIRNLISRIRAIKSSNFDIVHGFESRPTVIYPALKLKKKGTPLFLDWADWFGSGGSIEQRPNFLFRNFYRPIENYYETNFRKTPLGTSVICKTLAKRAIELGVHKNDICLLPNGFNVLDWEPVTIQEARSILNLGNDKFLIGYLGSLFPNDAKLLGHTVDRLNELTIDFQVIHIGKSNYYYEQKSRNPQQIIQTGPVKFLSMQTYLSACDVLLLPFEDTSANNGRFPLKFSNYLSCGRPIIATSVGDIPFYVRRNNLGIVTEDTPESIADAINYLHDNSELRTLYGEAAFDLSNDPDESWLSRANLLLKFYNQKMENLI
jgi:glycosyltransferase involved in cell wall biosynthesis